MKQSKLFGKTLKQISGDEISVNAQLLTRGGFIDRLTAGVYTFLPLGLQVLNNIENIVREEMNAVGGQEILMPSLQPKDNWVKTDRWDHLDVLFRFESFYSKIEYAFGPTHEEVVTPLAGRTPVSYKDLPFSLYQFQTKFRDERRAKSGILRGREFRMKDLYSFHESMEDLDRYYEIVSDAYDKIYRRLGIGDYTFKTFASGGTFSKYSHEFQTISAVGEDIIYLCRKCSLAINKEIIADQNTCPGCGNKKLEEHTSIEVGNIFKLGTKYSDSFDLKFTNKEGKAMPVIMGCYGIGPSRIMGTIVELFHDDNGIVWPESVAPYDIHLLQLGMDDKVKEASEKLYNKLIKEGRKVLWDDRDIQTGAKFADCDLIGIPTQIIVSAKTIEKGGYETRPRADKNQAKIVKFTA